MDGGAWWAAVHGVSKSRTRLSNFSFTFHFHALEKEMATHSSVLARRIPGSGEPGGLLFMGSHRVGHDWSDLAVAAVMNEVPPLLHILAKTLLAILVGVWWHWIMVLIYIFLNTNDMEHFLRLLLLGYPLWGKPFHILSLLFYWFVFICLVYRKFFIWYEY